MDHRHRPALRGLTVYTAALVIAAGFVLVM